MAENLVQQILEQDGPMLSSTLAKILESKYHLSAEAARKRVQRGCEGFHRLGYIVFPHRARFVYLQKNYGSPYFFTSLMDALESSKSAFFYALQALAWRKNFMLRQHFLIACGSPVAQKGHISAESILERLIKASLVKEVDVSGIGICVLRSDLEVAAEDFAPELKGRLIAERIALLAVRDWARNLGLVSYGAVRTREDEGAELLPKVGTFHWDLSGPSYLYPMRGLMGDKVTSGFLACDIALVGGRAKPADIGAFIRKCVTLRSLPKTGKCLQILLTDGYTQEALKLAKNNGVIPASVERLFGHDVASALKTLCTVLTDTAKLVQNPDALDKIFGALSRIEGAASTLRGTLFEFAVAQICNSAFPGGGVQLNRIIKLPSGEKAEVDIMVTLPNKEVIFIECKGTHPMSCVDDGEVEKWLDKRIPVLRKYAKNHPELSYLKQRFELWTSGKVSQETQARVALAKMQTNKYELEIRDGDYVSQQVSLSKEPGLQKSYSQHFVNHPMLEYEQEMRRLERKAKKDAEMADKAAVDVPSGMAPGKVYEL
ncbi:hypothetical protein AXW93_03735 [Pseudomonas aeruginosa]|uniref:hypothetical protein n=1 Tax=Pseudomonas aeruginosa TaxID=287 RepID=UPI0009B972B9|nr:hypothetical protein [Pseudomonas aeruginosa]ARC77960.1 hypothetical protein AXW93_03735 [Pseudomonas aeruginosa]